MKTGGSGDPNNNSRLATVIAKAKAVNMPNDNIKRTIDKALGANNTDNYESVVYEGYGPNGVAVIVEALTDNRQRTAPEVRHLLDKFGKGLGATGCVSWSFDRKGVILLDNEDGDLEEDTVMMDALDCGASDFEADGDVFTIYAGPTVGKVAAALEAKGYVFASAQVEMVPQNYVKLTDDGDIKNMEKLIDALEDNDDVQNVYHNWEQGKVRQLRFFPLSQTEPFPSSTLLPLCKRVLFPTAIQTKRYGVKEYAAKGNLEDKCERIEKYVKKYWTANILAGAASESLLSYA